jgi:hypothetical protein
MRKMITCVALLGALACGETRREPPDSTESAVSADSVPAVADTLAPDSVMARDTAGSGGVLR